MLENARGDVLLLRRSPDESFAPGLWGFPGGHLEPGESPLECVTRELAEEIGDALPRALLRSVGPVRDTLYGGVFEIHLFLYRAGEGAVELNPEHDAFAWVSPEAYRGYSVVDGVDEDLFHLGVWPVERLNGEKLKGVLGK